MAKENVEQSAIKYNKFQGFLLVVVIPLLFAITVTLIILTFLGINVFEKAEQVTNKIPFISSMNTEKSSIATEEYESKLIELEGSMKDREAEIDQLEKELENKEAEIHRSELEQQRLQDEINELLAIQEENKRAFDDILQTYETISPKRSAPILSNMDQQEALKILSSLKSDTLAAILEKMEPADAAKFTELLTTESEES